MALSGYIPQYGQQGYGPYQPQGQGSPYQIPSAGVPYFQPGGGQAPAQHKEKKGFFGKVFGGVKAFVKGATVGFVKAITNPKSLLMIAGGIALTVATGGAAAPYLIGLGIATSGFGLAKSAATAAQLYAAGETELAEKALEGAGTNATGLALSVAGARSFAKTGKLSPAAKNAAESGKPFSVKDNFTIVKETMKVQKQGIKNVYDIYKTGKTTEGSSGIGALKTAARDKYQAGKSKLTDFYENSIQSRESRIRKLEAEADAHFDSYIDNGYINHQKAVEALKLSEEAAAKVDTLKSPTSSNTPQGFRDQADILRLRAKISTSRTNSLDLNNQARLAELQAKALENPKNPFYRLSQIGQDVNAISRVPIHYTLPGIIAPSNNQADKELQMIMNGYA